MKKSPNLLSQHKQVILPNHKESKESTCIYCRQRVAFEMPKPLLGDFLKGDVALFVGSGVSTESQHVFPESLYDSVADELGYEKCDKSFPDLMEEYCSQPNGRIKLLSKIKNRF